MKFRLIGQKELVKIAIKIETSVFMAFLNCFLYFMDKIYSNSRSNIRFKNSKADTLPKQQIV